MIETIKALAYGILAGIVCGLAFYFMKEICLDLFINK